MENIISIGFTKKPHGLKGEIKLHIEEKYVEDVMNAELLILDIKGKKTPFFVEDVRFGNAIIAKFEEVNSPEGAAAIASKEIFLRESDLIPEEEREIEIEKIPFEQCVGYTLFDFGEKIGIIEDVIEFPQQLMATINIDNREVLVPLNEHFVKKCDDVQREIYLELPEGILDL